MLFLLQMKVIQVLWQFRLFRMFLVILLWVASVNSSRAQYAVIKNVYDTNYICSYIEDFTGRGFSSVSFAGLSFTDKNLDKNLSYAIHSKLKTGLGFNYSIIGINLGFSPFHTSLADAKYGQTKSFDFRMNMYGRSIIFDLYFMTHQGFYLSNPESILKDWPKGDTFPLRPDIQLFSTGLVAQYIFNHQKFSMRATYVQNEWQKKAPVLSLWVVNFFIRISRGIHRLSPIRLNHRIFWEVMILTIHYLSTSVSVLVTAIPS